MGISLLNKAVKEVSYRWCEKRIHDGMRLGTGAYVAAYERQKREKRKSLATEEVRNLYPSLNIVINK